MKQPKHADAVSHGVDALISRLRDDGVAAGRQAAQDIVAAAEAEAADIRATARREAEQLRDRAMTDAEAMQRAAIDAIQAAGRDAVLRLRSDLMERFSAEVRALVSDAMADPALVRELILEVAAGARDAARVAPNEPMLALTAVPHDAFEDLRRDLDALRASPVTQLVLAQTGRILAEGVVLGGGVLLQLREGDLEIDLSDAAVASVLLAHLQPRFRALFDGIIR
jgi:V/A-type H+-transporting ATPase subunit E